MATGDPDLELSKGDKNGVHMFYHDLKGKRLQAIPTMRTLWLVMAALVGIQLQATAGLDGYRLYDARSDKEINLSKMLRRLKRADVILFGETHNSVVDHQVQLQLAEGLYGKIGERLMLGAEMFEADDQLVIDEFLSDLIPEDHLLHEAKTWKNYPSDYAPLLHFARDHDVPFIATNVPKRYAGMVARRGMEVLRELEPEAGRYMAPLPVEVDMELSSYKTMLSMMEGHLGPDTDPAHMVQAQALKDATMAYFIDKSRLEDGVFLHINGSYHSDHYQGIMHYLKTLDPGTEVRTITSVQQDDLSTLDPEHRAKADFILVLPTGAPRSY